MYFTHHYNLQIKSNKEIRKKYQFDIRSYTFII